MEELRFNHGMVCKEGAALKLTMRVFVLRADF
ncbi:uncharacterized protein G2W53_025163 [Senna tora]|uniref:Uncharacterized protein n=1 Tax=Senna tora TaxID=362788 RepID=A0A834WG74_9FABA|nr:uncharacterized protein G2W53_025163 [Senna tora]